VQPSLESIASEHLRYVRAVLSRLTGSDPLLDDLVNEGFVAVAMVVRNGRKLRHPRQYWLRASLNRHAKLLRQRGRSADEWHTPPEAVGGLDPPAERRELQDLLQHGLRELHPIDRFIVVARATTDQSFEQIAGQVGLSRSGARRRYEQGMDLLRQRLTAPPGETL